MVAAGSGGASIGLGSGDGLGPEDIARLRNAALRVLRAEWVHFNREYVDGELEEPSFELSATAERRLGCWSRDRRVIQFSERHVFADRWCDVLATLRHEMAHQYADEVLGATGEPPHGSSFREACQRLRADPAATTELDGARQPGGADHPVLGRLRKLLALGRSANRNEAELALRKARELMQQHQLDESLLQDGAAEGFAMADVGPIRQRNPAWRVALGNLLSEHFAVRAIWVHAYDAMACKMGRNLRLFGRRDRVAFAAYVHDWIAEGGLLERLWRDDKRGRGARSDRDRQAFYHGVVAGFRGALDAAQEASNEADAGGGAATTAELVAGEEVARVDAFLRWHHPHVTTRTVGGRSRGHAAYGRGVERGKRLALKRPIDGSDGGPRLLGGPS